MEPNAGAGAAPGPQGGAPGGGGTPGSAGTPPAKAGSGSAGSPGTSGGEGGVAGATGACVVGGVAHRVGEPFACDCNTCWCDADGRISSTLIACYACTYAGEGHQAGEVFPAGDGCNQCSCSAEGEVLCTEAYCSCDPAREPYRTYVALDPTKCAAIDYVCPPNAAPFNNECGCGCETAIF